MTGTRALLDSKRYEGGNNRSKDLWAVNGTVDLMASRWDKETSAEQTLQHGSWNVNGEGLVNGTPEDEEMHLGT